MQVEEPNPTEAELRAFVGPRADRYWRRWRCSIERGTRSTGGLWPPFLFNFVWFLYRRMYREVWVPIAMVAVVGFFQGVAEGVIEGLRGTPFATPKLIDTLINLGLAFATSYVGSFLYLRKFRNAVVNARRTAPDAEATLAVLRTTGGTSRLAAAVGILLAVVLTILSLLVQDSG